jgi:Wiskott-Aldrich syndrome protein
MLVSQLSTDASRADDIVKVKEEKKEKEASSSKGTPTKKKRKGILKSLISGPVSSAGWSKNSKKLTTQSAGSFQHVAHMGYDSEKGFSSVGVDPSWQKLLEQLSAKGFSRSDLENNEEFIKDFVNQAGGIDNVSKLSGQLRGSELIL